jgi:hypothetical protein
VTCDQTEDGSSPGLEIKVDDRGGHDFRVDVGGVQTDVTLAFYLKVSLIPPYYGDSEFIN